MSVPPTAADVLRPAPRPDARAEPRTDARTAAPEVPSWVHALDQPVWVTGPDGRLRHLNRRAEAMLGIRAADWIGRPCEQAVAARDGTGRPFCGGRCAIRERAACGAQLEPVDLAVGPRGGETRWARVTSIPVAHAGGGAWIVHAATDLGRARRVEAWLERVAARSDAIRALDDAAPRTARRPLSPRESEILTLLVEDHELPRIAHRLGISRTTVRNHVQRLLAAVGAHSVQEAVALRLLGRA